MARNVLEKSAWGIARGFLLPIDWQFDKWFMELDKVGIRSHMHMSLLSLLDMEAECLTIRGN